MIGLWADHCLRRRKGTFVAALQANVWKYLHVHTERGIPVYIRAGTDAKSLQKNSWSLSWVKKTPPMEHIQEPRLIFLEGTFACGNKEMKARTGGSGVTRAFSLDSLCSQPTLIASPRWCRKRVHLHLLKGVSWPSFKIIWKSCWSIWDETVRELRSAP